jgi:glycosyltransferase involved in cell wall biosynthesis
MRVDVSVIGRFHAFNLAKSLQDKGLLNKLFTTLPKFRANYFEIKTKNIVSCWWCEALVRVLRKLNIIQKNPSKIYWYHHCYMNSLNKYIEKSDADIFIGFAGVSLEALKIAKSKGMITILERGSSHRIYQQNIMQEEYVLTDISTNINFSQNEEVFQRELLEYNLVDYISIPSSFVKRTFLELGFSENKLIINPYGVNLQEFKQIPKKDNVFRIIFAGNGSLRKGYHYLLQAFYELNLPNCELWHLGGVSEEIKPFLKKYKNNNWILKGHKPQRKLYKYYSQGSVFILPSLEEGFAMVQFQAMACGLPLVCSTNTGGEDLISKDGEEGFVIPIRDTEAIKEKILYLYKNQDICKEMGQKAKRRIESGYSWDDYGDRYIQHLNIIKEENNVRKNNR